ncbi:hypothetical protein KN815_11520, partial [Streptomyces sp. 4503]
MRRHYSRTGSGCSFPSPPLPAAGGSAPGPRGRRANRRRDQLIRQGLDRATCRAVDEPPAGERADPRAVQVVRPGSGAEP